VLEDKCFVCGSNTFLHLSKQDSSHYNDYIMAFETDILSEFLFLSFCCQVWITHHVYIYIYIERERERERELEFYLSHSMLTVKLSPFV